MFQNRFSGIRNTEKNVDIEEVFNDFGKTDRKIKLL